MFAVMLKTPEGSFLAANKDGTVNVQESPDELLKAQEDTYNEFHGRGYEASMSACMHFIQFNPVVIKLPDTEAETVELLDSHTLFFLKSVSGFAYGWKLKPDVASDMEKTSIRPRLISPKQPD